MTLTPSADPGSPQLVWEGRLLPQGESKYAVESLAQLFAHDVSNTAAAAGLKILLQLSYIHVETNLGVYVDRFYLLKKMTRFTGLTVRYFLSPCGVTTAMVCVASATSALTAKG